MNSLYGIMGQKQSPFSNEEASAFITGKGREITTKVCNLLEALGGKVIQTDTDGMWSFFPQNFPQVVTCNSGKKVELLKCLINFYCDSTFGNTQYREINEASEWATVPKKLIYFEGSYGYRKFLLPVNVKK